MIRDTGQPETEGGHPGNRKIHKKSIDRKKYTGHKAWQHFLPLLGQE
jgi:hypothetical protein